MYNPQKRIKLAVLFASMLIFWIGLMIVLNSYGFSLDDEGSLISLPFLGPTLWLLLLLYKAFSKNIALTDKKSILSFGFTALAVLALVAIVTAPCANRNASGCSFDIIGLIAGSITLVMKGLFLVPLINFLWKAYAWQKREFIFLITACSTLTILPDIFLMHM